MSQTGIRRHQESVTVEASPQTLHDLVFDGTRTGEWSPVRTSCWWDDEDEAGRVGAWFTGRNELPNRTWETRSGVVADRTQQALDGISTTLAAVRRIAESIGSGEEAGS